MILGNLQKVGLAATRALSALGLAALMALAAMTLADGTLRWLANRPIEGVRDVGAVFIAVAVSCCLPMALMERGHISIRLAADVFGARAGRVCDALAAVAVWAVTLAMAWQFTVYAGKIARVGETTWVLQIPTAPFWYAVAAILWVSAAVQAIMVLLEFSRITARP